jgi:long-chain acyl-CoA synthetase
LKSGGTVFLTELLERQKNNDKKAIKHGSKEITFQEWYSQSQQLSRAIEDTCPDGAVNAAIFLPNSIDYAVAYFALLFSNKVIVPIGTQSKGLEITSTLEYCEVDLITSSLQYRDFLKKSLSYYKHRIIILYIEDQSIDTIGDDKDFVAKSNSIVNTGIEDDVAIMLHTSGTTSNPKRVMLTHSNLINNVESNIQSLKLTANDKVLISMPMHFGYCNTAQFLTHLYLGASMVILDGMFLPKIFFQTVQDEKITNFTGVPSMLLMLLEYRYIDRYDINSLRYVCFGGGNMPVEKLKQLIQTFKTIGFVQTYGQTEASPRTTALLPEDELKKIGSVGFPLPNVKVKIFDGDDEQVANQIGEIVIQGKNVMKGYYKQPVITAETIVNGWLHTGDLGYLDNAGYLYLTGRKKNIIISGGINIYPEEIEEVLMSHPNVKEAYVTSEEHPLLGEVPLAKIVMRERVGDNFRAFCTDKLAEYKIPVRFEIVDQIDKTYNGKIKRF